MKNLTKNTIYKTFLSLLLVLTSAVYANADVIRLTIKEELTNCTGVAPQTCFQVKYKNSKNWELFYNEIAGFNYKPGYRYVIDVIRTNRKKGTANASTYTYKLKKIVEKKQLITKKPNSWTFILKHNWKLIQLNGITQSNTTAYLNFKDEKTLSGSGGCNRIFGSFEWNDDELNFKNIASTRMACLDNEKSKLETEFLKLLTNNSFKFDIAEQTLNFYKDNKLVLMFGMAPLDK